jgi:asparagine synthetase B (glutamine-hydrolysing)
LSIGLIHTFDQLKYPVDEKNSLAKQICTFCVMDSTDQDIIFDQEGRCNHFKDFEKTLLQPRYSKDQGESKLRSLVAEIKKKGENSKYDCLIGVSGGVDSSYAALLCKQLGLRPLLMHVDKGWNSDIAVKNIKKLVDHLGVDYESYLLDWKEFREIQLAFLKIIHC